MRFLREDFLPRLTLRAIFVSHAGRQGGQTETMRTLLVIATCVFGACGVAQNAVQVPDSGVDSAPASLAWQALVGLAPAAREGHSAVWTGSEMLVWGGWNMTDGYDLRGMRYDAVEGEWHFLSSANEPSPRGSQTAVWTGSEMIVWGGEFDGSTDYNDGGRFDPVRETWITVSTVGAPSARKGHVAVWTGSEMIVWGGNGPSGEYFDDGARYRPENDGWVSMSNDGAPLRRVFADAVWTGSEMIVWGGLGNERTDGTAFGGSDDYQNSGGRYDPVTDEWRPLYESSDEFVGDAPIDGRENYRAVWTGSEMVIWGGSGYHEDAFGYYFQDGAAFDPEADTWRTIPSDGAPNGRTDFSAVWTGSQMIVWGGQDAYRQLDSGGVLAATP